MNRLSQFLRRKDGGAAAEFAILLPLMLLILGGATDLGLGAHAKLTLQSALNAGLQYGMKTQGNDAETVKAIILNELSGRSVTVNSQIICACQSQEKACTASCPQTRQKFLRVTVSEAHRSLLGGRSQLEGRFQIHTGNST